MGQCDSDAHCVGYVEKVHFLMCEYATNSTCNAECSKWNAGSVGDITSGPFDFYYKGCYVKAPTTEAPTTEAPTTEAPTTEALTLLPTSFPHVGCWLAV